MRPAGREANPADEPASTAGREDARVRERMPITRLRIKGASWFISFAQAKNGTLPVKFHDRSKNIEWKEEIAFGLFFGEHLYFVCFHHQVGEFALKTRGAYDMIIDPVVIAAARLAEDDAVVFEAVF